MAFLTSCFIRVEDPEELKKLIEWLKEIGWRFRGIASEKKKYVVADSIHQTVTTWSLDDGDIEKFKNAGYIFCDSDLVLFCELSAMNDESNMYQWFVVGSECAKDEMVYVNSDETLAYVESGYWFRKATSEEITNHFKDREK